MATRSMSAAVVALDTSHLGNLARDLRAQDEAARTVADALTAVFEDGVALLFLSFHHLQELLVHADEGIVEQRLQLIERLPLVAVAANHRGSEVAGSVFDLQAAEALAAYHNPTASARDVRDIVHRTVHRLVPGVEAAKPFRQDLDVLHPELVRSTRRGREIVALTRADFAGVAHLKVTDILRGRVRSAKDLSGKLREMEALLRSDLDTHADRRIENKNELSTTFIAGVAKLGSKLTDTENPAEDILRLCGIDLDEVEPGMTVGDAGDRAVFRRKLELLNHALGLPWNDLKRRVNEERLPSGLVDGALRRHRPRSSEWKGSDLIDTHMACFAPYCDLAFVDKRTHEGLRVARNKSIELDAVLRRVEKARSAHHVLQLIAG